MYYRRRSRSLLEFMLAFLGLGFLVRRGWFGCFPEAEERVDAERQVDRAKLRLFRSKLRDAFSVWEDDSQTQTQTEAAPDVNAGFQAEVKAEVKPEQPSSTAQGRA